MLLDFFVRESRVEFFPRSGAKDVTLSAFSSASAFSPLCRQTPAVDQLPAQNTSDSELLQQIIPQKSHSTESALVLYSSDCPGVEAELCHQAVTYFWLVDTQYIHVFFSFYGPSLFAVN